MFFAWTGSGRLCTGFATTIRLYIILQLGDLKLIVWHQVLRRKSWNKAVNFSMSKAPNLPLPPPPPERPAPPHNAPSSVIMVEEALTTRWLFFRDNVYLEIAKFSQQDRYLLDCIDNEEIPVIFTDLLLGMRLKIGQYPPPPPSPQSHQPTVEFIRSLRHCETRLRMPE